jgi:hypothetical protein
MKDAEVLAEALKGMHGNEGLELAVGRVVRNHNGKYEDYLRIIGSVRDLAYAKGISAIEAAKEIAYPP